MFNKKLRKDFGDFLVPQKITKGSRQSGSHLDYERGLFSGLANQKPSYHAAGAGACLLIYARAIEKTQSLDPDKIREELGKLKMMTFFGAWNIDETGKQIGHIMVTTQWQGGNNVVVWPREAAGAKLFYPLPTWAEKVKGKLAKE